MAVAEIRAFLDRKGLTIPEYHVLQFVHYASVPPDTAVRLAAGESEWWHGRLSSASREECEEAVGSLIVKGVLQVVDETALERIREVLDADLAFGPFDGLPEVGHIDFTTEGGSLWQEIERDVWHLGETWTGCGEGDEQTYIATSKEGCRRAMSTHPTSREILSISDPEPIGPWRNRWWDKRWETGFRMVVLYLPEPDATAVTPSP